MLQLYLTWVTLALFFDMKPGISEILMLLSKVQFGERSDPPFIFYLPLLGIPPKKNSSSLPFEQKFSTQSIKPHIPKKPLGACWRSSKRAPAPSFFVSLLEKVLIYPFLVQITHGLLSLLGAKRS